MVEACGRFGAEVVPFLRQHAPAEEPLRSAVLARATREISIVNERGLAALFFVVEPRLALVLLPSGARALPTPFRGSDPGWGG